MVITILFCAAGVVFSACHRKIVVLALYTSKIAYFLGSMWLLPFLSTILFMPLVHLGESLVKFFDQGWVEYFGGQGSIQSLKKYSSFLDYYLSLGVKSYLLVFMFIVVGGFIVL
jgi:hypothetical protein